VRAADVFELLAPPFIVVICFPISLGFAEGHFVNAAFGTAVMLCLWIGYRLDHFWVEDHK